MYNFQYDAENRMTTVSGSATASFVFDGDGNRVKSTVGGVTTVHIGAYFEWTGSTSTMKKYYSAGGARIAMRTGASTLNFILSDHLGSTSVTTDSNGGLLTDNRYKAWGEPRYASGTLPTKFTYTGQYSNMGDFGLMYYGARWYDSQLSRFAQADTLIPQPGNPLTWDRYAYVLNNSINYTDPTGHDAWWCNGASCQAEHYAKLGYGSLNLVYGVTFTGTWTDEQKYEVLAGVSRIVSRINDLTYSSGMDGIDAYKKTYGNLKYYMDQSGDDNYCERSFDGSGVNCFGGYADRRNVAHELGHVFSANENDFATNILGKAGIYDKGGNWVTGRHNDTLKWERGWAGYKSKKFPWVHHGIDWGDSQIYTPSEEFADMFMNWVWISFKSNDAGDARMDWMNTNLADVYSGR